MIGQIGEIDVAVTAPDAALSRLDVSLAQKM